MKDFGATTPVENSQSIAISSSLLYDFLARAELTKTMGFEGKGKRDQFEPGITKRHRQKPPLEELNSDDEQRFLELEEQDAKKVARMDENASSYDMI